jgi:hypothetical protein
MVRLLLDRAPLSFYAGVLVGALALTAVYLGALFGSALWVIRHTYGGGG